MRERFALLALAFAAMAFTLPFVADPYMSPKLAAMALVCLPLLLMRGDRDSAMLPWVIVGLLAWGISAAFSSDYSYSLVGTYISQFDGFTSVAAYALIVIAVARLDTNAEDVAEAICWVAIPVGIYGCIQRFWPLFCSSIMPTSLPGNLRVISTQGSPVYLGSCLAVAAVCAAYIIRRRRVLGFVSLAAILPALWLTQTRGALIGTAAGLFVLLPKRMRLYSLAALPLVMFHPRAAAMGADMGRIEVWSTAWRMFLDHPLVGVGPGTFGMVFRSYISPVFVAIHGNGYISQAHAHNEILHVLATTGVIGLAGWLAVAYGVLRATRGSEDRRLVLAATAAYLACGMFNPVPHSTTAMLAMIVGAAAGVRGRAWRFSDHAVATGGALAVLSLTSCIIIGDWYYLRAMKAWRADDKYAAAGYFGKAAEWNRWEMEISARNLDAVAGIMGGIEPDDRKALGVACLGYAREALARHPRDPVANESVGKNILVAQMSGTDQNTREAMYYFKRAQELAPTFPPLMMRRKGLAQAMGDSVELRRAVADLANSEKLAAGG